MNYCLQQRSQCLLHSYKAHCSFNIFTILANESVGKLNFWNLIYHAWVLWNSLLQKLPVSYVYGSCYVCNYLFSQLIWYSLTYSQAYQNIVVHIQSSMASTIIDTVMVEPTTNIDSPIIIKGHLESLWLCIKW